MGNLNKSKLTDKQLDQSLPDDADLSAKLDLAIQLLQRQNHQLRDWKLAVRNGLLSGLGSAIGVSIVLSLLIHLMQPFKVLSSMRSQLQDLELHGSSNGNGNKGR